MQTPYFIINEEILNENIASFSKALEDIWANSAFGYSVKTNSLPWLLGELLHKGIYAEVVSDEEIHLAKMLGYPGNRIIFNGPIKGDETFRSACSEGTIINLDSKNDLSLLEKYGTSSVRVGIRVNLPPYIFDEKDIGYEEDGFRFGFSEENGEFQRALDIVYRSCGRIRIGLHLHCNSITRSKNMYVAAAKYAASIIRKYNLDVLFIDIGGGFFGGVPGKTTPAEYLTAIKNALKDTVDPVETTLIIEPGSAIIGSAVDLYTSVLDTKDTIKARIVTTDGSRIHIDPLWAKQNYLYSLVAHGERNTAKKQIICGYTCMDHDRIMTISDEPELLTGDLIIYHRVGAYSVTFGGAFIRYLPEVYIRSKYGGFELIRHRMTVDEYYQIQTK